MNDIEVIKTSQLRIKHPDCCLIHVHTKLNMGKTKLIVKKDVLFGSFIYVLRRKCKDINSATAIFALINDVVPMHTHSIGDISSRYADSYGILHVDVFVHETYG